MEVIETDATYFLHRLKSELIERHIMIPDSKWGHSLVLGIIIKREHDRLFKRYRLDKHPEMLFSAFYQDGVKHACGAIIPLAFSGIITHQCSLTQTVSHYVELRKERLRNRNYGDVAYIEGYINGLIYPVLDEKKRKRFPKYFLFGPVGDIHSFHQYSKLRVDASKLHKSSYDWAKKAAAKYDHTQGSISLHHRPFL